MPTLTEETPASIRVAPSAVMELMWVLHFIQSGHKHEGDFAALDPLRERFGNELTRLRADRLIQYSTEVIVLAHASGTLLDMDLRRFFARVEGAMEDFAELPSLRSEKPGERKITRERLQRLRQDRDVRNRYLELLHTVWREVEPLWEAEGRGAVVAEADRWQRALDDEGAGFREVLGLARLWPSRPDIDDMADAAAIENRLVLNPCWFGGKVHMFELEGTVYVGKGIRHGESSYRKVASEVSGNIKALADPTRLTILMRLARQPSSVTELARQLHLSQPTVSAHVQVLREAGLLDERAVGRSAELSASEDGVRRLFARSEDALMRLFRP